LVERAIRNSSNARDIVLDTFAGRGTTIIASEKSGRQARLLEIDPRYCDVIIRRWQDFTGQQARHEESGRAFNDVAAGLAPPYPGQPELKTPPGEPSDAGAAA
jgi:DNA modification methylase